MTFRHKWLKPYSRIEEGMEASAIVMYGKHPTNLMHINRQDEVAEYYHQLRLNLWWLQIQFNWYSQPITEELKK